MQMNYKIKDIEESFDGSIVKHLGNGAYIIKINDNEHQLKITSINSNGIEFILDQTYHKAKYLGNTTNEMNLVVNHVPVTINLHTHYDSIVYKNSGGSAIGNAELSLKSQIPGKVVSLSVAQDDTVQKGDIMCTLESMKMQVAIKAHKDGVVSVLKIKEGDTLAKGDVIAEIQ